MGLVDTLTDAGQTAEETLTDPDTVRGAFTAGLGLAPLPSATEDVTGQDSEDALLASFGVGGLGYSVADETQESISDVQDSAEGEVRDTLIEMLKNPWVLAAGVVALLAFTPLGPMLASGAANEVTEE